MSELPEFLNCLSCDQHNTVKALRSENEALRAKLTEAEAKNAELYDKLGELRFKGRVWVPRESLKAAEERAEELFDHVKHLASCGKCADLLISCEQGERILRLINPEYAALSAPQAGKANG